MSKLIPMVELKFRGLNVAMSKPQIEYLLEKGQELETKNTELKQEKKELIKWLEETIDEDGLDEIEANKLLSKLKESDGNE